VASPRAALLVVRLQSPIPLSFTYGWEMTKEPARSLYRAALPPLAVEPFWALSPLWDSGVPEASSSCGNCIERAEWEEAARTASHCCPAGVVGAGAGNF